MTIFTRHQLPKEDMRLLDEVQQQTFGYFWEFAHPASGMIRERSITKCGYGSEVVTIGGTGFGIMAIIVAAERGWVRRKEALARLVKIVHFLARVECYHGVFSHFIDGEHGTIIPFTDHDDGSDIVETSYLMAGLICAREYFDSDSKAETVLRDSINALWARVEWNYHARDGYDALFWHWSPRHEWRMNHQIRGWNECLITYVLAAASRDHPISARTYHEGFATGTEFKNGRQYYGIELPLGPHYGGPNFFSHYSFLGLDPRGLRDCHADYWQQNVAHTLINRAYCIENPLGHQGYSKQCWGLTASDNHEGYSAHAPHNDLGVISPTAALSAFPYTPDHSMQVLRHLYEFGDRLWGKYGFYDAFNLTRGWFADSYLAIDQGPIIIMIENYRSGLLWKLFMRASEVASGLRKLGFTSPHLSSQSMS